MQICTYSLWGLDSELLQILTLHLMYVVVRKVIETNAHTTELIKSEWEGNHSLIDKKENLIDLE